MVCMPLFIAMMLAFSETVQPAYVHYRECCAVNPVSRPRSIPCGAPPVGPGFRCDVLHFSLPLARRSNGAQAFPPTMTDFFLRGQTTCLPGHERLTQAMPAEVEKLVAQAKEDLEAERLADSVNRDLDQLIAAARHFAAVLYAPGDVKIDGVTFPPMSMRTSVHQPMAFALLTPRGGRAQRFLHAQSAALTHACLFLHARAHLGT